MVFRRTEELDVFMNLSQEYKQSTNPQKTNEVMEILKHYHNKIKMRFDESMKWCIDYLGIPKQVSIKRFHLFVHSMADFV